MPRYYFHFSDGNRIFTDRTGLELVGLSDVRRRVITQIRRMKNPQSGHHGQDWSLWSMIVVDADGKTALEVGFDLKPKALK